MEPRRTSICQCAHNFGSRLEYLKGSNVFDNLTLLKMWIETTAKQRR